MPCLSLFGDLNVVIIAAVFFSPTKTLSQSFFHFAHFLHVVAHFCNVICVNKQCVCMLFYFIVFVHDEFY